MHEIQVGQGIHETEIGHGGHLTTEALEVAPSARVHREHHGSLRLDPRHGHQEGAERSFAVDIAGPVQREQTVVPGLDRERLEGRGRAGPLTIPEQRIDHHVADEVDPVAGNPFPREILVGRGFRGEEEIGHRIGEEPVDLLRHGPIEAAEPRLHVSEPDPQLCRGESSGQRGVDVPHHKDEIGPRGSEHRLEAQHDLSDLGGGARSLDVEVYIRIWKLEVGEEGVRHGPVVVLARVDQCCAHHRPRVHLADDRRDLHEIGPGADNGCDLQCVSPWVSTPALSRMSRTGANRKSLNRRSSFPSVLAVLTE